MLNRSSVTWPINDIDEESKNICAKSEYLFPSTKQYKRLAQCEFMIVSYFTIIGFVLNIPWLCNINRFYILR